MTRRKSAPKPNRVVDGSKLRAERLKAGMSVLELAEAARTTIKTINRLEAGSTCHHRSAARIALALRVSIRAFSVPGPAREGALPYR